MLSSSYFSDDDFCLYVVFHMSLLNVFSKHLEIKTYLRRKEWEVKLHQCAVRN